EDGLVVYQGRPERVHHLNNTAAFVFVLSTGDRTVAEIAEECRRHFGLDAPPLATVTTCVEDLRSLGLVV
ncbi:MAG TPA: PqqD family peptide modification chaperone, partial [Acidimicrobiia bacterium]|nr:PqqD family peptide modification chaperone [Acidimicrobiia bacterium]